MAVPKPFQSLRALRNLNVAAVGLALATVTAGIFGLIVADSGQFGLSTFVTGLPTLLIGSLWAAVLRWRKTVGRSSFRWGWLSSVPLAMTNAGLAAAILLGWSQGEIGGAAVGFALGCTFGAIAWLPAMMATLVAFGLPIAWSQALARKGLAGEERGEWIVGLACVALSLFGLVLALSGGHVSAGADHVLPHWEGILEPWGRRLLLAMAGLGTATGLASTLLARRREAARRRFVAEAEEGQVPGYRVDASPEGKVLVRVTSHGEGYRVSDFREEVFALDEEGQATRALALAPPRR
ncbi:MAG: hypothetical protein IPF92_11680 [Myxococcales bacterium]|nr:hypothetical protein [Myxococcales bacterium]MBL0198262.1 hypothetical protein [Myxococcales bacterium]HQY62164.1 hypothetical protein [Polyangiaceae bacterium]